MSVNLDRISKTISRGSSHNGFGNIVSFPSVASFPPAGSFNSWLYDVTYPIANGGGYVYTTANYPNQFCDVEVKNNGTGGTYIDWATATDVQYFAWGNEINSYSGNYTITVSLYFGGSVTVDSGSYGGSYYHDGTGGYYTSGGASYVSYGTYIASSDDGSNYYTYYHDGSGGYYESYYYGGG